MSHCVLIVDDSPAMRAFIRRVIQLSGFPVDEYREAGNGKEALALLAAHPVDVILTDINMPEMNGEELVRRLAADTSRPHIPVVVVSTDSTESRVHRLRMLGVDGYLSKPFSPESLREELERALGVEDHV